MDTTDVTWVRNEEGQMVRFVAELVKTAIRLPFIVIAEYRKMCAMMEGHRVGGSVSEWLQAECHHDDAHRTYRAVEVPDGDYDDEAREVATIIARACWDYNECNRLGKFDNEKLVGMAALMKTVSYDQAQAIMDALAVGGFAVGRFK